MNEFNAQTVKEIADSYPEKCRIDDYQKTLDAIMTAAQCGQYSSSPQIKTLSSDYVINELNALGFETRIKEKTAFVTRIEINWK